jgi:hypothetical protein
VRLNVAQPLRLPLGWVFPVGHSHLHIPAPEGKPLLADAAGGEYHERVVFGQPRHAHGRGDGDVVLVRLADGSRFVAQDGGGVVGLGGYAGQYPSVFGVHGCRAAFTREESALCEFCGRVYQSLVQPHARSSCFKLGIACPKRLLPPLLRDIVTRPAPRPRRTHVRVPEGSSEDIQTPAKCSGWPPYRCWVRKSPTGCSTTEEGRICD